MKGEEMHSFAHRHIVKSVDFSPDSNHFLTGSNEKLLRIFDLNKPEAGKKKKQSWLKKINSFESVPLKYRFFIDCTHLRMFDC